MRISKVITILDWIFVLVVTVFIFLTLDFLPVVWDFLESFVGDGVEFIPVIFIGSVVGFFLFYTIFIKKQKHLQSYGWFMALVVCLYFAYSRIESPSNKMHLFEYFILSFAIFRVLHHYVVSTKLYFLGAVLTIIIAIADETTQVFSPVRGFSFSDLGADFISATLGQISIALVIRPKLEVWRFTLKSKVKGLKAQQEWLRKQNNK